MKGILSSKHGQLTSQISYISLRVRHRLLPVVVHNVCLVHHTGENENEKMPFTENVLTGPIYLESVRLAVTFATELKEPTI